MLKEFWKDCNVWQRIMSIYYLIAVIAAHIVSIWGLIDVSWAIESAAVLSTIARILLVLLLISCVALDTLIIVTNWFLGD